MPDTIIVTDRKEIEAIVAEAVRAAMLEAVPDAVREAQQPEWMGRDEVCERYGLTPRQLTYMRSNGRIEYTQHGRRILYNRASLQRWIDEGRVTPRATKRAGATDDQEEG